MVAKRSAITIATGSHACIEIATHATLFFMVNMASTMDRGRAPNDDNQDVAQRGDQTPANNKSCNLGLQCISLLLNIQIKVN